MPDLGDLARAMACLRELAHAGSTHVERLPFGAALRDERSPLAYNRNYVLVEGARPELDPGAAVRAANRALGDAGLAHRKLVFEDVPTGERLAAALAPRGWSVERNVVMALAHVPVAEPGGAEVREVDASTMRAARAAAWRDEPGGRTQGDEEIRQLAARAEGLPDRMRRHFAAFAAGAPASFCDLYLAAGGAQVEDVYTMRAHRRRGLAAAVVGRATREAAALGADPVFILADPDGDARRLYERLGFVAVGGEVELLLAPPPR